MSALVALNDIIVTNSQSVTTAATASNVNLTEASFLLSAIVDGFGSRTVGRDVSEV